MWKEVGNEKDRYTIPVPPGPDIIMYLLELGDITILLFIMILKCHDNWYWREIFSIVLLSTRYYHKYCDYCKIHCSQTFTDVKRFHLIFTILVVVVLFSNIVIISVFFALWGRENSMLRLLSFISLMN